MSRVIGDAATVGIGDAAVGLDAELCPVPLSPNISISVPNYCHLLYYPCTSVLVIL